MDFSKALEAMKDGKKVTRHDIKGGYIELIIKLYKESVIEEIPLLRLILELQPPTIIVFQWIGY